MYTDGMMFSKQRCWRVCKIKKHMEHFNNTFSWTHPDILVDKALNGEYGVFAGNDIKSGELLAVFGGYVFGIEEESDLPPSMSDNALQISEDLVLGIKSESDVEIASYFNHSCDPNAGFKGQVFLQSMRDIKKREQVTFDYGMVLFRSSKGVDYEFECLCGDENCRKVITNHDWKRPELQKKYNGYFQHYLEEKIKNQK